MHDLKKNRADDTRKYATTFRQHHITCEFVPKSRKKNWRGENREKCMILIKFPALRSADTQMYVKQDAS